MDVVEKTLDGVVCFCESQGIDIDVGRKPPIRLDMHRNQLAQMFAALDFRIGAEIGVLKGGYSRVLAAANPEATIYSIDPWIVYGPYTQEMMDEIRQAAQDNLGGTNCVIMRRYSDAALSEFKDGELDFVYIDANHEFEYVVHDIKHWGRKVRRGGIVSGHDWARYPKTHPEPIHVKDVVNAWTYSHHIRPWFVCKRCTSWFWVNGA